MKVTQHTPKQVPVKNLSNYDLGELADLFWQITSKIERYAHVTESGQIENVIKLVKSKQLEIVTEIDRREDLNY